MKTVGNYNKVSKELMDSIPTLEGTVTFQLLTGQPNPDEVEAKKTPMLYGKHQIRTAFRIKDPFAKEKGSSYVDIVVAEDWKDDKPTAAKPYIAGLGEVFFNGKFSLSEGNVEDEELYEVFMISPERLGSTCADKAVQPLFKLLDAAKESKEKISSIATLKKALGVAEEMSEAEATKVMASMNYSYGTPDELMAAIGDFAKNDPERFLFLVSDPKTELKATLKEALDKEVLSYDPSTLKVYHGKSVLTTLKDGTNVLDDIADWLNVASNGNTILDAVKKQVKKK